VLDDDAAKWAAAAAAAAAVTTQLELQSTQSSTQLHTTLLSLSRADGNQGSYAGSVRTSFIDDDDAGDGRLAATSAADVASVVDIQCAS